MAEPLLPPVWILAGPEIGLKETFVADIIQKARRLGGDDPEIHRLYAGDSSSSDAISLLRNSSLFSSWVIVEFRNVEQLGQNADIAALTRYCGAPAEQTVLFLETEGYAAPKAIEKAVSAACRKTFFELFENELAGWVRRELAQSELSLDGEALESLLELVPHDTASLKAACLILSSSFSGGSALSAENVEAAILRSKPEDAFTLFEKIGQGELPLSLEVLDSVLDSRRGDANQIIAALVWSFRRLQRIGDAVARGERFEDACLREGARSKTVQRQLRAALQRSKPEDCRRIILALSETEAAIRGPLGTAFDRQLLHLLITSIITEKGRGLAIAGWSEQGIYPQFKM
jgi:DNA polymerase III delta subunit